MSWTGARNPADALAAAGLQPDSQGRAQLSAGDLQIGVEAELAAHGYRLRCSLELGDAARATGAAGLARLALSEPGDSDLQRQGDRLVAGRRLVEPSPLELKEAVRGLAQLLVLGRAVLLAETPGATEPAPPSFAETAPLEQALAAWFEYVTVAAPQPAWPGPAAGGRPAATLQPGTRYRVLQRAGGWAQVFGPEGRLYTDARGLIPTAEPTP
ncbi:MAG TPA: hypothetical protein VK131_03340 [Candidatus Acidoferrales bacterium]|nr:hypothetical protein [Candidatus Acidoferrales bacterium]